jgi:glucose/arabinose dehydrogenase
MAHALARFVLWLQIAALLGVALVVTQPAASATVPNGFAETQVATGLAAPTAMAFAPDGRLFVAEQGGRLRVIKNGTLLGAPFLTLNVNSAGERGLLGVAFDPNFAVNQYVYVYYTTASSPIHNRLSRFTAMGDVVAPGPETVIMELENLSSATNHNGGAIHFGPDGALYIAVGDNANGANSQTLGNRLGKILRINADGTIPTTNPFYGTTTGANRSIWALGLRNPFTFTFQRGSSRMFINDVGQNAWEEIDDGVAGSNYGWPETEGPTTDPRFRAPLYSYGHGSGATTGCAITGGAFYNAATMPFPGDYAGDYFFADYCSGWIRRYDPANGSVTGFASGIASPVDLTVANDGSLYYLARGSGSGGSVFRVAYTAGQAPTITTHPSSQTVPTGGTATFTVAASGTPPLSYQWQRNGVDIPGATSASYTLSGVTTADNGATFRARVTNSFGSVTSNSATLTVTANQAPSATITQPAVGTLYSGGQTVTYAGTGTDPEQGTLPASAFTWQVDFHHASHVHPFIPPTSGETGGSFVVPTVGHTESDVWYRVILTVRDSAGLTSTVVRDIQPRKVDLSLWTSPAGLSIRLDSQPQGTPLTVTGVVGIERTLEAPSPQTIGGTTYEFDRWSDGGARVHTISTPTTNTTYTAFYRAVAGGDGLSATYYDNQNLTGATVNRVDGTVDFVWGAAAPATGIAPDTFSARWAGTVLPPTSGTYTFFTESDDGVRLWVDGRLLVDNWTDHSRTENSGTIALTAGVRYAVRMEFYENGGDAVARLLWTGPSVAKAVIPRSSLFSRFGARVNFQPASTPVPAGYLADTGTVFGLRPSGERYGWNADNAAQTRDRNAANSPDQRYDTLTHLQKPGNPNAVWELAVPNGTYTVRAVAGDADHTDSVFRLNVEGVLTVSGTPSGSTRWFEGTSTVTVTDGRLTVSNGSGASNNKICFIEVS